MKGRVLFYSFIAASEVLAAAILAVTVTASAQAFAALVRGMGLVVYTSDLVLISQQLDIDLLVASSAILSVILMFALRRSGSLSVSRPTVGVPLLLLAAVGISALTPGFATAMGAGAAGTLLVAYAIVNAKTYFHASPRFTFGAFIVAGMVPFAAVEVGSAVRWVANGFDGVKPFSDPSWRLAYIDLQLFNTTYGALPQLVVLFFAAWIFRLLSTFYWTDLLDFVRKLNFHKDPSGGTSAPVSIYHSTAAARSLLVVALVSVVLVGTYPYLPAINPSSKLVGVDVAYVHFYPDKLSAMLQLPPFQAIASVATSDRFLYLLAQYTVALLVGSPDVAIRLMPSLLGVLLVLTTYWFVNEGSKDRLLTGSSSFLAAFSLQVTTGVNAGFYANWLAISFAFAFFALFLRGLDKRRRVYIAPAALFSIALLFTHPWTWFVLVAVVATFLLVTLVRAKASKESVPRRYDIAFSLAVLGTNAVPVGIGALLPGGSVLKAVYSSPLVQLDPLNIVRVYDTLQSNFLFFLGGAMANPVIFILSIVGFLSIASYRSRFHRVLLSWTIVASVSILFVGSSADFLQSRVLYIVPFQVVTALGFLALVRFFTTFMLGTAGTPSAKGRVFMILSFVSIYSMFLSYALRTVGFLFTGS